MRLRVALTAAVAVAVTVPAAARADVFAVTQGLAPGRQDADIVWLNLSTGLRLTLPAAVNTTDVELHPSITPDGKRLVFERESVNATRIVLVDLTTGQSADLFNGFEQASRTSVSPAISPDGRTVATGGPFQSIGGTLFSTITLTDVSAFPNGPFPHSTYKPQYGFAVNGQTADPVFSGSQLAFRESRQGVGDEIVLGDLGGQASTPLGKHGFSYTHPSLGAPGGAPTVLLESRLAGGDGQIAFRSAASLGGFPGLPTPLPFGPGDASLPAFTPDSRYVGFVHDAGSSSPFRVQLWDSQTQTIVNGAGAAIGSANARDEGNLSLYSKPLFSLATVVNPGLISVNLLQGSGVGILVQRVVGHHKLFGRTVPKLRMVGRVPLGQFKQGKHRIHWNRRVNGRRLKPGTYQITVRAVTPRRQIRDLGKPKIIKVP